MSESRQDRVDSGFSIEDAETFAAQIKPSWDIDWEEAPETSEPPTARLESNAPPAPIAASPEGEAPPPKPAPAPPVVEDPLAATTPSAKAPEFPPSKRVPPVSVATAAPAPMAGERTDTSDTIIEGVPTVDVGTPEPEPPPPREPEPVAAAPSPVPVGTPHTPAPIRPGKTKLGIGADGEAPPRSERKPRNTPLPGRATGDRETPVSTRPPPSSRTSKAGKAPLPLNGTGRGATTGAGRASAASATDEYRSERSESVEIPVTKSPLGTILKVAAVAAVLGGVVLGIKMMAGSEESPAPPATTASPPTTTTTAATTKPPEPPATTPPAVTAPPPPDTTPPATAAPPTPPPGTAAPTPPKGPRGPGPSVPPKPPEKPTGKKPGTGGLIRETPF